MPKSAGRVRIGRVYAVEAGVSEEVQRHRFLYPHVEVMPPVAESAQRPVKLYGWRYVLRYNRFVSFLFTNKKIILRSPRIAQSCQSKVHAELLVFRRRRPHSMMSAVCHKIAASVVS